MATFGLIEKGPKFDCARFFNWKKGVKMVFNFTLKTAAGPA